MENKIKNIAQSEVLTLRELVEYREGQVVSRTLAQNAAAENMDDARGAAESCPVAAITIED